MLKLMETLFVKLLWRTPETVRNFALKVLNLDRCSVSNSSDELIFVKRRALDGPFLDKNTGFRRAHRRAKFTFLIFFFLFRFAKKVKIEQN